MSHSKSMHPLHLAWIFVLPMVGLLSADIPVRFEMDLGKNIRAISPLIYGSNTDELTKADGVTFRRSGGNRLTGYNWENNASNAGTDWQNSSDAYLGGGTVPGKAITDFLDKSMASGSKGLITLQTAGNVAKDKNGTVLESETAPSARWAKVVFEKGSAFTQTPDANDDKVYMDEFVDFLAKKYGGAATENGVQYYAVDNEPALWPGTHPRIHPLKPTCLELIQKTTGLSLAVKKVDPAAMIFGGVFYGYGAYANFQEAADWAGIQSAGKYGWFLDYFLDEMKKASDKAGKRLLDVLDIHWYSEAFGDHRINDAAATTDKDKAARMQAPRSLWDSTYTEKSWISQTQTTVVKGGVTVPGPILLLPHILASIQKYYPGTKLAITEYNYGGDDNISGGIATADYLGILGREGVFASSYWKMGASPTFVASAIRLYRNFDGMNSTFGALAASAQTSDNENTSVYASFNSGGNEVHIITLNKSPTQTVQGTFHVTATVSLSSGQVFGFTQSGVALSEKAAIPSIVGNAFSYTLPPLSAYHFVLKSTTALPIGVKGKTPSKKWTPVTEQARLPAYLLNGRSPSQESGLSKPFTPFFIWLKGEATL